MEVLLIAKEANFLLLYGIPRAQPGTFASSISFIKGLSDD